MHLVENSLYHIYNRGNNKQQVFLNSRNYIYFLSLIRKNLYPACDILAWCLMPNHFHLLIHANQDSVLLIKDGGFERQQFSQGIKQLLSTYTKSFNKVTDQTGSIFQQKTKSKDVTNVKYPYALTTFHYIHQNPFRAKLVKRIEDWEFSSFKDYSGLRNGNLCNAKLAIELLDIDMSTFYSDSYNRIDEDMVKMIL